MRPQPEHVSLRWTGEATQVSRVSLPSSAPRYWRKGWLSMVILLLTLCGSSTFGQPLSSNETTNLELRAQSLYQDDNLQEAAASYLELATRATDARDRGGFALLAGWILHQAELPQQRDQALLQALREDPSLRPDPAVFSAEFLQVVQDLRLQLESSLRKRYTELSRAAEQAFRDKDYDQATRHYQEIVGLEPNRVDLRLQLAVAQLNAGKPSSALQTLLPLEPDLQMLEPELRERFFSLSTMAQIRTGDTSEAGDAIRRVSGPVQRQLWLELASAFQRAQQWEKAVQAYGSVLEIDPADRQTAILRSQLLVELGQTRDAESFLVNLSETLPTSNAVWHQLGATREKLTDHPGAMAAYRHATAAEPADQVDREGYLQALVASARLLRQSDPKAASMMISRALNNAPEYLDALAMNVRLLGDQQRHSEAIQLARRIVNSNPDRMDIENLLGNSYYRAQRYAEAIVVFENLLLQHPDLEAVRENLVLAQRQVSSQDTVATPASDQSGRSNPRAQDPSPTAAQGEARSRTTQTTGFTDPNHSDQSSTPDPRPDPSGLPVGLTLAPFQWAQTGRSVLRVEHVATSSKGERCGLVQGDLLIRAAGEAASSAEKVERLLADNTSGMRLDVVRELMPITLVCI